MVVKTFWDVLFGQKKCVIFTGISLLKLQQGNLNFHREPSNNMVLYSIVNTQ